MAPTIAEHAAPNCFEIIIGPKDTAHHVHKSLLMQQSGYFRKLYEDGVDTDPPLLGRLDSNSFVEFAYWSFKGELRFDPNKWGLVDIYLLAAQLDCPGLEKLALEKLREELSEHYEPPDVTFCHDSLRRLPPRSKMWYFIITTSAGIMAERSLMIWNQLFNVNDQVREALIEEINFINSSQRIIDPELERRMAVVYPLTELLDRVSGRVTQARNNRSRRSNGPRGEMSWLKSNWTAFVNWDDKKESWANYLTETPCPVRSTRPLRRSARNRQILEKRRSRRLIEGHF